MPGPRETWSIANGVPRQVFGTILLNVHPFSECVGLSRGFGCPLHGPTKHRMYGWPLSYRADREFFERSCIHGVGHPDPDSINFHWATTRENISIHGCDGCCSGLLRED